MLPRIVILDGAFAGTIVTLFAVIIVAAVLFLAAVWFGLHVLAPRIGRAIDRAEAEDEGAGDRAD
jgi:F0F1-type ATP synthase membrane subunit b/b'